MNDCGFRSFLNPIFRATMEQTGEKKRRNNVRIGVALGLLVLIWYIAAMFVVLRP